MARQRLDLDARRAQLIELGLELFAERSYEEISIHEIAQAAGISKGLLYHYFANKRDFYVATVRVAAERFRVAVQPDPDLAPLERARQGLERYLAFVDTRARAFRSLMSSGIGVDPEVAAIVESTRHAIVDRMLADAGFATPPPRVRTLARAWIGAVEAASLDWLEHRDLERDALVNLLVAMLVESVVPALSPGQVPGA